LLFYLRQEKEEEGMPEKETAGRSDKVGKLLDDGSINQKGQRSSKGTSKNGLRCHI